MSTHVESATFRRRRRRARCRTRAAPPRAVVASDTNDPWQVEDRDREKARIQGGKEAQKTAEELQRLARKREADAAKREKNEAKRERERLRAEIAKDKARARPAASGGSSETSEDERERGEDGGAEIAEDKAREPCLSWGQVWRGISRATRCQLSSS